MRTTSSEHYSTRCLISHRPDFMTGDPLFYRCPQCGEIIIANSSQHGRGVADKAPFVSCCGVQCVPLEVCTDPELCGSHPMRFVVFGGYERNSVRIEVESGFHPMEAGHRIEWIYMRTFQGGQLKMLPSGARSFASFSLADYDAFVYCDRDICRMGREHCQFLCKRGMVAYAFCNRHGLFKLVLDGQT